MIDSVQHSKKQLMTKILNTTFIFNNHQKDRLKYSLKQAVKKQGRTLTIAEAVQIILNQRNQPNTQVDVKYPFL